MREHVEPPVWAAESDPAVRDRTWTDADRETVAAAIGDAHAEGVAVDILDALTADGWQPPTGTGTGWRWDYGVELTWPDGTREVDMRGTQDAAEDMLAAHARITGNVVKRRLVRRLTTFGHLEAVPDEDASLECDECGGSGVVEGADTWGDTTSTCWVCKGSGLAIPPADTAGGGQT